MKRLFVDDHEIEDIDNLARPSNHHDFGRLLWPEANCGAAGNCVCREGK